MSWILQSSCGFITLLLIAVRSTPLAVQIEVRFADKIGCFWNFSSMVSGVFPISALCFLLNFSSFLWHIVPAVFSYLLDVFGTDLIYHLTGEDSYKSLCLHSSFSLQNWCSLILKLQDDLGLYFYISVLLVLDFGGLYNSHCFFVVYRYYPTQDLFNLLIFLTQITPLHD